MREERARRQLFAVAPNRKIGSRESAYMGWSRQPQLRQMREKWEREEGEKVTRRVRALLRQPLISAAQVPLEFRGLEKRERGRLHAWRQKAGSLQKVVELNDVKFDKKDIYIFLKESFYGPFLHHIYLWQGSKVSDLSLSSAYQNSQQLLLCLPGGAPLHREVQDYESGEFIQLFGERVACRPQDPTHYVNTSLNTARLYNLNPTFMSFQEVPSSPPSYQDLLSSPSLSLLDTPTRLWVWLPDGYWGNHTRAHYQRPVLEVAESFLSQKRYSKWVPVTVLTQHCETLPFLSNLSSWPDMNFDLVPVAWQQRIDNLQLPQVAPPTTRTSPSDTKLYRMEGGERRPLPPVPSSHLSARGVYMFQWTVRHNSPLYMWLETSVCVWVGGEVGDYWGAVRESTRLVEKEMPLTLVPSGQEPPQLLSFFQGHLVVHSSPSSSPHPSPLLRHLPPSPDHKVTRLYQVSGSSLEHIKAIEVPPTSSSLCSSHCYILSSRSLLYTWSGHLSYEDTRTGALYIAQIINSSQKPLLVAEGQEPEEFWTSLGGRGGYRRHEAGQFPNWSLPQLYSCQTTNRLILFNPLPPTSKKDLKSTGCYLMWFKNQLFVWVGNQWKANSYWEVIKSYLSQYHSGRSPRHFVVTVAHEGHEGEDFWRWFELQKSLPKETTSQLTTPTKQEITPTKQETTPTRPELLPTRQETTPTTLERVPEGNEAMYMENSDVVKGVSGDMVEGGGGDVVMCVSGDIVEGGGGDMVVGVSGDMVDGRGDDVVNGVGGDMVEGGGGDGVKQGGGKVVTSEEEREGTEKEDGPMVSPFKTPEAVRKLSAMITELDKTSLQPLPPPLPPSPPSPPFPPSQEVEKGERVTVGTFEHISPTTGHVTGHVTLLPNQTESDSLATIPAMSVTSLATQDDEVEVSSKQRRRSQIASIRSPQNLAVRVEVEGGRVWEVTVREAAPVITVMSRVAKAASLQLDLSSSIFEVSENLRLHRPLEEHELLRDVLARWPTKFRPKLILRRFQSKTMLWGKNPPLPKTAITAYLKQQEVPELTQKLSFSPRASRKQWREATFSLRASGIHTITKSNAEQLCVGLEHQLYSPIVVKGRSIATPTPYCFAMKPPGSWKEKDVKLFCCPSLSVMAQWVHAIRLIKHGLQLKANLIAIKQRLEKNADSGKQDMPTQQRDAAT